MNGSEWVNYYMKCRRALRGVKIKNEIKYSPFIDDIPFLYMVLGRNMLVQQGRLNLHCQRFPLNVHLL